jgi:hypothetical protein
MGWAEYTAEDLARYAAEAKSYCQEQAAVLLAKARENVCTTANRVQSSDVSTVGTKISLTSGSAFEDWYKSQYGQDLNPSFPSNSDFEEYLQRNAGASNPAANPVMPAPDPAMPPSYILAPLATAVEQRGLVATVSVAANISKVLPYASFLADPLVGAVVDIQNNEESERIAANAIANTVVGGGATFVGVGAKIGARGGPTGVLIGLGSGILFDVALNNIPGNEGKTPKEMLSDAIYDGLKSK